MITFIILSDYRNDDIYIFYYLHRKHENPLCKSYSELN